MPTYDYACDACQHTWDEFQSITAAPKKKCPQCGKPKARRLISAGGGFLFKGSGFYITDYRSESYKKRAEADHKAATGGDAQSASKTDGSKTGGSKTGGSKTGGAVGTSSASSSGDPS
uniref:Zinc ribbon domain-containing protein n=1 Tax=Schlesneria paludicola TaxID=360056 RepID=A0A7C4LNI9_9PLAN